MKNLESLGYQIQYYHDKLTYAFTLSRRYMHGLYEHEFKGIKKDIYKQNNPNCPHW